MKEFEETLIHKDFMKVHKSTIVNINFVKKFVRGKSGHLVMSDGSVVAVSSLSTIVSISCKLHPPQQYFTGDQ